MPLIPKQDATSEANVTSAKEALAAREATEAKLAALVAAARKNVEALLTEATDLSVAYHLAQAEEASKDRLAELAADRDAKLAELKAARAEVESLGLTVTAAAGHTADSRMALTRVSHRNSVNRVGRQLDRILAETVRLESAIATSAGHYNTVLKHMETLRAMWPAGELPVLEILTTAGLNAAVERHAYKVSAVIDSYLNIPTSKYPGSRCGDMMLAGKPEALPDLSQPFGDMRRYLLDILEGRKDLQGRSIAAPMETIHTGLQLKAGAAVPVGQV